MAHNDNEIGRMLDALEASGELENTLVFCILGDNGASAEEDSKARSRTSKSSGFAACKAVEKNR
jgi:arylsulfatase A-like enzyme